MWRHDRCTLPASGSLSFTSRGLINQKEAPLPSLSLSPRLLVAFSFIPCHRHPLLSAFIFILLFRFSSPACIHACMYVYIYIHPLRDESGKGVVGRVSAFLSRPCREKPLAPDAAYAENIAEVATHCPGVAVECSFADDGVISSYYTL